MSLVPPLQDVGGVPPPRDARQRASLAIVLTSSRRSDPSTDKIRRWSRKTLEQLKAWIPSVVAGGADPGAWGLSTVFRTPGSAPPATTTTGRLSFWGRAFVASILVFLVAAAPRSGRAETPASNPAHEIILVVGAPGEESYQAAFSAAAAAWRDAARRAGAHLTTIGLDAPADGSPSDRERVQRALAALDPQALTPAWLVYLGHGTFDHQEAFWNLRGPDLSAQDLAHWLEPLRERTLIVVHGGSASGPFLPLLSGPRRIIITATRSGEEVNYARFGERFAQAIGSPRADLDQDGSTSVLEAFLFAAKETQTFYAENGRMATEHALIDDNGDRLGTPADWFQGVRVIKRPDGKLASAADGFRAHQIALIDAPDAPVLTPERKQQRDQWEQELEAVRRRRGEGSEAEYLRELERVLRKLATVYRGEK